MLDTDPHAELIWDDQEFYIKWKGQSYLHCQWQLLSDLAPVSIKKEHFVIELAAHFFEVLSIVIIIAMRSAFVLVESLLCSNLVHKCAQSASAF